MWQGSVGDRRPYADPYTLQKVSAVNNPRRYRVDFLPLCMRNIEGTDKSAIAVNGVRREHRRTYLANSVSECQYRRPFGPGLAIRAR